MWFPRGVWQEYGISGFRSSKMILNPEIHKHITARKVLVNLKHDDIYYELTWFLQHPLIKMKLSIWFHYVSSQSLHISYK